MIDRTNLEQVVHAQINEILEANWVEVCPTCSNIPPEKVSELLALYQPGISQLNCGKCRRSGVLVMRQGIWSLA